MRTEVERVRLATIPTPLERGPQLPGGARLWVKRDDLTGLGMGGNKARKLEYLCGEAMAAGATSLVTVGAAQSNHCRMTAAAGAMLGLDVHLVVSGDRPSVAEGNQRLATLFGAQLHYTGSAASHWGELEIAREALVEELTADGDRPFAIPIGGSTPTGSLGYLRADLEIIEQCADYGIEPAAIVHASSSGGTHAGLLAGRAVARSAGRFAPEVLAIGVARGVIAGMPDVAHLANETLAIVGHDGSPVARDEVEVDPGWIGDDYAVPTAAGDEAARWAARQGGWVVDRVYTGKALAGLLGAAADGRWASGADVIFLHTGGTPSLFAADGYPELHLR